MVSPVSSGPGTRQPTGAIGSAMPAASTTVHPADALALTGSELQVMAALREMSRLTFTQLLRVTGVEAEELRVALAVLGNKGLVVRLETVIASYSCALAETAETNL